MRERDNLGEEQSLEEKIAIAMKNEWRSKGQDNLE